MDKVTLRIDGYKIEANKDANILQAALDAGIYIPHLCYHPDLPPGGNCKLCGVEIKGKNGIVQSCETTVEEGMVVETKTEAVNKLRITALELILASHPKDCTSCDKYLNCELQSLLQYLGVAHSRLREITKNNTNIQKSDVLIKKEMERCIQCGRCVRVCEEVRGVGALTINKKDGETYISTKEDVSLLESECRFCGACVEVCPTGAIQDVKGIFSEEGPREMKYVPCKNDCPAHTDIPLYLRLVNEGRYSDSVSVIREKLTFPLSLGHICTHACEAGCKRGVLNEPISIREAKKFAVENDTDQKWRNNVKREESKDKKIGIIGAGPSGMTAAYYLSKKGYKVEVFEKQNLAGGMLSYGIPKYRLPQNIVNNELEILKEEGMIIHTNKRINSIEEIQSGGYDAVLISTGATKGKRPPVFNKNWLNSIDAVEFCRLAIEDNLPSLGKKILIYGGGNVAFDAARTAVRKGIKDVKILCMESREEMLADDEEIQEGLVEGIEILNSKIINKIVTEEGKAVSVETSSIRNFEFTKEGLKVDIIENSNESFEIDTIVFATGQKPELTEEFGIELVKGSFAKTDKNLMTDKKGVFAAGDVVYGTKSVVEAIASGRKAASSIDLYLGGNGNIEEVLFEREPLDPKIGPGEGFCCEERKDVFNCEADAKYETSRCLQCDLRLDIKNVKHWVDSHYKNVKEVE